MKGSDLLAQVTVLAEQHSAIFSSLDQERVRAQARAGTANGWYDDFGTSADGGRGESYVVAQQSVRTRVRGIAQLIDLITRHSQADSPILVDLLGGDGLVSHVASLLGLTHPVVVTCDASPFMVAQAWLGGIPALLQRAESTLFRNDSVGAVMLAYGSHHIPPSLRAVVAAEAFRALEPGGVFLIHDFLPESPVSTWFGTVVDVYSATGHKYDHYDRDETVSYLTTAGFTGVQARMVDDAFVVSGSSCEAAELALGKYLLEMYGLVRLVDEYGVEDSYRKAFDLAGEIFRYSRPVGGLLTARTRYDEKKGAWFATMPREALVVIGRKPLTSAISRAGWPGGSPPMPGT